eukprot:CAMPEP_0184713968 /NCGR_PEP_ID=MMETSP0314-20130426/4222_1 /TAXON_ID=38298 /ORGANISM="Rhodella maculata, Strain CCMP 736" /LENGTH=353 /DNA_ID=CAMNT_0027176759 /DNA_START=54 /DNA_END=1111 /DNA_ORIENTATION=-
MSALKRPHRTRILHDLHESLDPPVVRIQTRDQRELFAPRLDKLLPPPNPDLLQRLQAIHGEARHDDGQPLHAALPQLLELHVRVRLDPLGPRGGEPRLERDGIRVVGESEIRGDAPRGLVALRAVAVAIRLDDAHLAAALGLHAEDAGVVGPRAVRLGDAVEGHEEVVDGGDRRADDVGVGRDVSGVVVERGDDVDVRGGVLRGAELVRELRGGARAGGGELREHGDDDDAVGAGLAEGGHRGLEGGGAELVADLDGVLLAESLAQLPDEILGVVRQRRPTLLIPDLRVRLRGLLRPERQHHKVEQEELDDRIQVHHPWIAQKLREIRPHVLHRRARRRPNIHQHHPRRPLER